MADRRKLRRRVLLPLVLLYALTMVLTGLREEIRPAVLDRPVAWATAALERFGIHPGLPVFSSTFDQPGYKRIVHARCLDVRASAGNAPLETVYPDGASCPPTGIRFRVPNEEVMLNRLLMWATASEAEWRMEDLPRPPAGQLTYAEALLPAVAHHFRYRQELLDERPDRLALRLSHHVLTLDPEGDEVNPVLILYVSFVEGPSRVLWFPTPEQAKAAWPEEAAR